MGEDVDRTFELYKIQIEEIRDARRGRRELANTFITLNIGGLGAVAIAGDPARLTLYVFGLVMVCILWSTSNAYYTLVLNTRYSTLYEFEKTLGFALVRQEWGAISRRPLTWFSLERALPSLFILAYLVFLFYQIPGDPMSWLENQLSAMIAGFRS
ncbi:hypothetical protein [Terricaulis sp.]|uniref:RipA family octameric membrane protein n=1 Tax=Terricaulis sp. TaxID=2768686 RepID=UPI00378457C0